MKITNIHSRTIDQPIGAVSKLLSTLATPDDKVWPKEKWPSMKFTNGIEVGSKGGHGPIKYFVKSFTPWSVLEFEFLQPKGFNGIHKLELIPNGKGSTTLTHTIDARTNLIASIQWIVFIRVLHNALIEDAFDKVENQFSQEQKISPWNWWVRMLRTILR